MWSPRDQFWPLRKGRLVQWLAAVIIWVVWQFSEQPQHVMVYQHKNTIKCVVFWVYPILRQTHYHPHHHQHHHQQSTINNQSSIINHHSSIIIIIIFFFFFAFCSWQFSLNPRGHDDFQIHLRQRPSQPASCGPALVIFEARMVGIWLLVARTGSKFNRNYR